jgi:hypothetical protein
MKIIAIAMLIAVVLPACSSSTPRGATTQMFPDCTQVSAEQQRLGNCIIRPETPDPM